MKRSDRVKGVLVVLAFTSLLVSARAQAQPACQPGWKWSSVLSACRYMGEGAPPEAVGPHTTPAACSALQTKLQNNFQSQVTQHENCMMAHGVDAAADVNSDHCSVKACEGPHAALFASEVDMKRQVQACESAEN